MPVGAPTKSFSARWVRQDHLPGIQARRGELVDRRNDGALDRVGGGQPGAARNIGVQQQVQSAHVESALLQRPQDPQRILGPAPRRAPAEGSGVDRGQSLVPEGGQQPDGGVRTTADRHTGGPVDRKRQHETLVVVGVLADQVDAAGRLPHAVRRGAEDGLKPGGQLPGVEARRHAAPAAVAGLEWRVMDPRYTPRRAAGYGGDHGPAEPRFPGIPPQRQLHRRPRPGLFRPALRHRPAVRAPAR